MSETQALQAKLVGDIEAAADLDAVEALRVAALGKAGSVTGLLKTLGGMTPEERQVEGPKIHALREAVAEAIATRRATLESAALEAKLAKVVEMLKGGGGGGTPETLPSSRRRLRPGSSRRRRRAKSPKTGASATRRS